MAQGPRAEARARTNWFGPALATKPRGANLSPREEQRKEFLRWSLKDNGAARQADDADVFSSTARSIT